MNRNKYTTLLRTFGLCFFIGLTACSDDKGNYDYSEKNILTITGIPEYKALLAGAEYIDFKPTITSTTEGVIEADNPNYEFYYQRKVDGKWVDLSQGKDINELAVMGAGINECLFTVVDKRTGVKTVQMFRIDATTITSEGWMVLCNEGAEDKVRMDMLSNISVDRVIPTHQVLEIDPELSLAQATNIGYYRTRNSNLGDDIILLSKSGAYIVPTMDGDKYANGMLDKISEIEDLKSNRFLARNNDHIIEYVSIPHQPTMENRGAAGKKCASICVSEEGNAYAWFMMANDAGFEYPINTSERGKAPEYRVAPFVGRSLQDCGTAPTFGIALFYDIDNHRFIGWDTEGLTTSDNNGKTQKCYPLTDPTDKKFSYQTGNMDLVNMISTANGGNVYCIMQEEAKRHVYVIKLASPGKFIQVEAYKDIQAPDFGNADCFAVSSQYPILYYAYKNNIYAYNLATAKVVETVTLSPQEEVTLLKFNIYEDVFGFGDYLPQSFLGKYDEPTRNIYLDREKQLIVGSYNTGAEDENGGILRFYDVANGGNGLSLRTDKCKNDAEEEIVRTWEYTGFARIVDVTYKEKQ